MLPLCLPNGVVVDVRNFLTLVGYSCAGLEESFALLPSSYFLSLIAFITEEKLENILTTLGTVMNWIPVIPLKA